MKHWIRLYELADELKALKPWENLYEDDVFGIRDPVTGKIGFVSFMGFGGEHYAMTVYLGERALDAFFELSENNDTMPTETILEIPQLQISFEDRDMLEKEDREIIRKLGKKYRGKNAWPVFRAFHPGMLPWFMDDTEQQSMIYYMEQAFNVAARPDVNESLGDKSDPDAFLLRDYTSKKDNYIWKDTYRKVLVLPPEKISFSLPSELIKKVESLPIANTIVEIDFFMTMAQIWTPGTRPYFPYMLMLVDKKNGLVLGHEMLDPSGGLEVMYGKIPKVLLNILIKQDIQPREIHFYSDTLGTLLTSIAGKIKIPMKKKRHLPSLEEAKVALNKYLK